MCVCAVSWRATNGTTAPQQRPDLFANVSNLILFVASHPAHISAIVVSYAHIQRQREREWMVLIYVSNFHSEAMKFMVKFWWIALFVLCCFFSVHSGNFSIFFHSRRCCAFIHVYLSIKSMGIIWEASALFLARVMTTKTTIRSSAPMMMMLHTLPWKLIRKTRVRLNVMHCRVLFDYLDSVKSVYFWLWQRHMPTQDSNKGNRLFLSSFRFIRFF